MHCCALLTANPGPTFLFSRVLIHEIEEPGADGKEQIMIADMVRKTAETGHFEVHPVGWLRAQIASVARAWRWYRSFKQTHDELNRLSDRDLDDLGIVRADIARISREVADGVD